MEARLIARCGALLGLLFIGVLHAEGAGLRESLEARGMDAEATLTTEFTRTLDGGVERGGVTLVNLDLALSLNTEAGGLWNGGTLFLYVLGDLNGGRALTDLVGDLQASSNIETDDAIKLYEAWYEHQLGDRLSLLVGLHDYNAEFDALEYAGLFFNSSFGIGPEIAQVGPSIFATTALAARMKAKPSEATYILAAVYDGIPGDPDNPRGTQVELKDEDGLFYGLEVGLVNGEPNEPGFTKVALGGWKHTAEVEDIRGALIDDNDGFYAIMEASLSDRLGGFLQLGMADEDHNQIDRYVGAGLQYTGGLGDRTEDLIGLAVAHARISDAYRATVADSDSAETAIELTYRAELGSRLAVQPDVQYIINPGGDPSLDDALQAGVRFELSF